MTPCDQVPFIVIWETTRACALACVPCRAEAIPYRDPGELTTAEARALVDRVAAFGAPWPLLVLIGGDPLRRPDIVELVAYATSRGLSVSLTPSGMGAATAATLRALRDAGLARLAVSLDGATAEAHDAFRGIHGSHRHTLRIIERARALALPLEINTTMARQTMSELAGLAPQVETFGVTLWALHFVIAVGRAHAAQALSAHEIEGVLHWTAALAEHASFGVRTTEAPHYLRILEKRREANAGLAPPSHGGLPPWPQGPTARLGPAPRAVTDGNGFAFVDHQGNICPSGFLPITAGNVRGADLVRVYREAPIFRSLRDPDLLRGRCGRCEYRARCGGSRARGYALTGNPFAEDPGCGYEPRRVSAAPAIAGGSDGAAAVTSADVIRALRTVFDPELGLSIVELGLVYGIEIRGGGVAVTMTLTAPGCPIHDAMVDWVHRAVLSIPGVERVDVTLTFDPPWSPARIGA